MSACTLILGASNPGIPKDSLVKTFSPFIFLPIPFINGAMTVPPTALAAACFALVSSILSSSTYPNPPIKPELINPYLAALYNVLALVAGINQPAGSNIALPK